MPGKQLQQPAQYILLTKLISPDYDERMSSGINPYDEISKLPIIKRSSTSSVSSYVGTENEEMVTLADGAHAGTGCGHHWAAPWWPGISPENALTCTAVVQISGSASSSFGDGFVPS